MDQLNFNLLHSRFSFKSQAGVGLIEALVSMIVLGFMVTVLVKYQSDNRAALQHTKHRTEAVQIATNILDSLQNVGLSQITNGDNLIGVVDRTSSVGKEFRVEANISNLDSLASSGFVISKKIVLDVFWQRVTSQDSTSIQVEGVIQ